MEMGQCLTCLLDNFLPSIGMIATITLCGRRYNSLSLNLPSHPILLKLSQSCLGCEILTG